MTPPTERDAPIMPSIPYYSRSGISIFHGDCLDVLPTLANDSVDMTLTDSPYLVRNEGRWDGERRQIVGDSDPAWVRPAFREIWRVMKPDTFCVSFYCWPHADLFLGTATGGSGTTIGTDSASPSARSPSRELWRCS